MLLTRITDAMREGAVWTPHRCKSMFGKQRGGPHVKPI
jgi:hypothetical protein